MYMFYIKSSLYLEADKFVCSASRSSEMAILLLDKISEKSLV